CHCQADPSPTKRRTWPFGPVFSHQPVKFGPIVDQIVLLTGSCEGRTSTSSVKGDAVQAGSAGTSAYCVEPSNEAAWSGSPGRSPGTLRVGALTYEPFLYPWTSTSGPDGSSKRRYAPAVAAFDAVTATRRVPPTSAGATTYVLDCAPARSTHAVPPALHRCH